MTKKTTLEKHCEHKYTVQARMSATLNQHQGTAVHRNAAIFTLVQVFDRTLLR